MDVTLIEGTPPKPPPVLPPVANKVSVELPRLKEKRKKKKRTFFPCPLRTGIATYTYMQADKTSKKKEKGP